ncbi:serine hydrolase domain-containing protein [uncultured Draconibacterium sp.]|uniref:serine hydrolase domain-containing protein n=1 Tax=uncultured Draconibacterium sp. TaxID=1573823 RepID=UPI002AA7FE0D|nr:serine hydrolase domain-containing protein [uncultured Draconibacterium sp.]
MHKSTLYLLVVFLISLACNQREQTTRLTDDFPVKLGKNHILDTFALKIKEHYLLPAVAIGVINNDGSIQTSVVGNNKAKNGVALTKKSKFQIASCTKSFTALLVGVYVDKGLLNWNTKVIDVFPNLVIHPDNRKITMMELLNHTSGLQQFWTDEEVFGLDSILPRLSGDIKEQRLKFSEWNLSQPSAFTRGEHHYSNAGYVVAAAILEKITGQTYEALVKEQLLLPMQLHTAEFGYSFLNNSKQPNRHMYRYPDGLGITLGADERIPPDLFNPCGFLSLSIEDFTKYLRLNIEMLDEDSELISKNTFKNLFKNYHSLLNGIGVGLGWQIIEVGGIKTYGHTGSDQTMRAAMSINLKQRKGVVFATNIGDYRSEQALVNVIHELIK